MIWNVWPLLWKSVIPVEVKLLTWECMTTFDEIPALETLESLFEREFPRACRRLQECGGFYRIWHLVSFNSPEGRRSRFLVALVEGRLEKKDRRLLSKRFLPKQAWLSAAADLAIRERPECNNEGNFLCYGYAGSTLCVLVFFEGRLCHWSEETFARDCKGATLEARMEQAVARFRRFLESDALFSRAKKFEEIRLQDCSEQEFSPSFFKVAARDAFWRGRDLQKSELNSRNSRNLSSFLPQKWMGLALLAFLAMLAPKIYTLLNSSWSVGLKIPNPEPIELTLPPEWYESGEVREPDRSIDSDAPSAQVRLKRNCDLPDFSIKGVVAGKLAMVSVAGESRESLRTLAVGDSLDSFAVQAIGREHVEFACGDSLLVRRVGK